MQISDCSSFKKSENLSYFGLLKLMTQSPHLWKPLFVAVKPYTLNVIYVFKDLAQPPTSPDELQAKTYGLFVTFVMGYRDCTGKVNVMVTYDTSAL